MDFNEIIIGIIGGGQLGKMLIQEGKKMGLKFNILDPAENCSAAGIADHHIIGDFYDVSKLKELAEGSHIITYEFEHIDCEILLDLVTEGRKVYPSPITLQMIQDKYLQKNFLKENNIATPEFIAINSLEDLYKTSMSFGFPMLLKLRKGGYDGKGNFLIKGYEDIPKAYTALGGGRNSLMVEAFVDFRMEISAIVARGTNGEQVIYPLSENIHHDNILETTIAPARISEELAMKGKEVALKTMELLEGIGIFCIEMFIDSNNNILVNEIAPRTHNSGHYTLEGCYTSQFAQHLRCILDLPLGSTELINPSVMINLLGDEDYKGKPKLIGVNEALQLSKVYIHFYGKETTKPLRKMGHVTIIDDSIEEALEKAEEVKRRVKVIGEIKEAGHE